MAVLLRQLRKAYGRKWPWRCCIFETRWPVRRPALVFDVEPD